MTVSITLVLALAGTGQAACFDVVDSYWDNCGNFWMCEWDWGDWCFRWHCIEDPLSSDATTALYKLGEMTTPPRPGFELIDGWNFGPFVGATESRSGLRTTAGTSSIPDEGTTKNNVNLALASVNQWDAPDRRTAYQISGANASMDLKGQMPQTYSFASR